MAALVTIGVYGWTQSRFLEALSGAGVALLLDLRQRRSVRGSEYAWANSKRLQAALADAGIAYEHLLELAPTTELRELQYSYDARQGVGKRSRQGVGKRSRHQLAPAFAERFVRERLDQVELEPIVASLPERPTALFCVEADPEACHRSLVAERLTERFGLQVEHLRP